MINKNTFRSLSYGVYIISTLDGVRPTGCVANSAMQITSEPATIAVSINHNNYTHGCILETKKFALTVLGEDVSPEVIGTLGYQSARDIKKFESLPYELKDCMPVIPEGCAYFTCDVVDTLETNTHTIFLGKVREAGVLSDKNPMTYAYYHQVRKAKSPKYAPTYIPE